MYRVFALLLLSGFAWAQSVDQEREAAERSDADWRIPPEAPRVKLEAHEQSPRDFDVADYIEREKARQMGWNYDVWGIWKIWDLEITLQPWYANLKGPFKVDGQTVFDVADVFGVNGRDWIPAARFDWRYGHTRAIVDFLGFSVNGETAIEEQIEIDEVIIEIDETVRTDLDVTDLRVLFGWTFLKDKVRKKPHYDVDLLLGLHLMRLKGTVNLVGRVENLARFDQIIPLPVIGLAGRYRLGDFAIEAEATGIAIDLDVFGGQTWDMRASIAYYPWDHGVVRIGYRYLHIGAFITAVEIDFSIAGPFLEFGAVW